MAQPAALMADRGDVRLSLSDEKNSEKGSPTRSGLRPQDRPLHDNSVSFEEYHYYAQQSRAEEETLPKDGADGIMSVIFPKKSGNAVEEHVDTNLSDATKRAAVTDEEWTNASRAMRTASIGAVFYLITTDILGPFGLPYAFASTGWG